MHTGLTKTLVLLAGLNLLLMGCADDPSSVAPSTPELESKITKALSQGKFELAERSARTLLEREKDRPSVRLLLGHALSQQGKFEEGLAEYLSIPRSAGDKYLEAQCYAAELELHFLGRSATSERRFRSVLELDSDHLLGNQGLSMLLEVEGRSHEMEPHLLASIQAGELEPRNLLLLGWRGAVLEEEETLRRCLEGEDDSWPLYGLAKIEYRKNHPSESLVLLRKLVTANPQATAAQALLGRILGNQGDLAAAQEWLRSLPLELQNESDILYVRGMLNDQLGKRTEAIACLAACLKLDPDHEEADYLLVRLLADVDIEFDTSLLEARIASRLRLIEVLKAIYEVPQDVSLFLEASELCAQQGRIWEAWGWTQLAARAQGIAPGNRVAEWERLLATAPLQKTHPDFHPLESFPHDLYKLPESFGTKASFPEQTGPLEPSVTPRFEDVAAESGLDFRYENGHSPQTSGLAMIESGGGGAGVLDYDNDGWPDICFAQGGSYPGTKRTPLPDQLFRNRGGKRYEDVTAWVQLGSGEFHHGAAVGDIDNDGFSDVLLTGPGRNRLYRNQGDGTFQEWNWGSEEASRWSTSAAIADLNGDGDPDLYIVNYLQGQDLGTRLCGPPGQQRICHPAEFPAERDQIFLNRGNGTFEDVSVESGIDIPDGKGLGVIVARLAEGNLPSIFVANDTVPNFLFHPVTASNKLTFEEVGLLSGVALDGSGAPQASMGIACGDPNRDGLSDLFVTNFHNESNTYYEAEGTSGFFRDQTRSANLHTSGFTKLGFGCQFLDANADGWLDLLILNGDIDDFSNEGRPFRQRALLLSNAGGRFEPVSATDAGPYFEEYFLGRGLTTLDWNQDGLPDAVACHLYDPAALLENRTATESRFLKLSLKGRSCSRDAVGARVRISSNRVPEMTYQITAGDGYLASNEKTITISLPLASVLASIEIEWPGGTRHTHLDTETNAHYRVVESAQQLYRIP